MEARLYRATALLAVVASLTPAVSHGASYRTANFVIEASTPELAEKIGKTAEYYRRELAIQWLGSAMPNWSRPCPIQAEVAPNLGAGGATSFVFDKGEVFNWDMKIQGSEERLLDSVLPHEVTHTIFASYFRRPLPRWADEGACTTVEHDSERNKQQTMLINFLRTGHGIAFDQMFAMKEYPPDVLPLYSQGYSLARFLIDQGGRQKFLEFVGDGMKSENWSATLDKHYGYANLKVLQGEWLEWVKQGSHDRSQQQPGVTLASAERKSRSAANPVFRAQSDDRQSATANNGAGRNELASVAGRSTTPSDDRGSTLSDRGWSSAETTAAPKSAPGWQTSHDSTSDGSTANHKSVYDRRPDAASSPSAMAPSASTPPPNPTPPAASPADAPRRDPEFLARRDSPASDPNHRVLMEWTKQE